MAWTLKQKIKQRIKTISKYEDLKISPPRKTVFELWRLEDILRIEKLKKMQKINGNVIIKRRPL